MTQTARIAASMSFTRTSTPDGGQAKVEQALAFLLDQSDGVGAGHADLSFIDTDRSIASNTTADFDFSGALADAYGATIAAVKVTALAIRAKSTNTTNLTIGGATNEWLGPFAATGDKLVLRPGEWAMLASDTGWAVVAGASDALKIANSTGAVALFDIGFVARSA